MLWIITHLNRSNLDNRKFCLCPHARLLDLAHLGPRPGACSLHSAPHTSKVSSTVMSNAVQDSISSVPGW